MTELEKSLKNRESEVKSLEEKLSNLKHENSLNIDKLATVTKQRDDLQSELDTLKKELIGCREDLRSYISQFDGIKKELDVASRDCAGYKAEANSANKNNTELKVQLDKKIHLLCHKEDELRDLKVKHDELTNSFKSLNEKSEQFNTFKRTASTRISRSLEREPIFIHPLDTAKEKFNGMCDYLPPPPRYELYTPLPPLRTFIQRPYEPISDNYRNAHFRSGNYFKRSNRN